MIHDDLFSRETKVDEKSSIVVLILLGIVIPYDSLV